ncbi:MAG: hypothetical protein AB7U05_11520 [Mangrovibacterium sp.]
MEKVLFDYDEASAVKEITMLEGIKDKLQHVINQLVELLHLIGR